jgi:hypothetical protein
MCSCIDATISSANTTTTTHPPTHAHTLASHRLVYPRHNTGDENVVPYTYTCAMRCCHCIADKHPIGCHHVTSRPEVRLDDLCFYPERRPPTAAEVPSNYHACTSSCTES